MTKNGLFRVCWPGINSQNINIILKQTKSRQREVNERIEKLKVEQNVK